MEEVGHIQLHLGAASGNMLLQGDPQALPAGSTLKGGVFYWQPGPGFLGEYTMQFERPDGVRILVRVKIVPKRYWLRLNDLFVRFGQTTCKPIGPKCGECSLRAQCRYYKEVVRPKELMLARAR